MLTTTQIQRRAPLCGASRWSWCNTIAPAHNATRRSRQTNNSSHGPTVKASPVQTSTSADVVSLELYDDAHSEFAAKVKVALTAKGLSWKSLAVPCGGIRGAEFLQVNPLGKIPALRVTFSDGRKEVVLESEVILEFLEEQFPQHPLLPSDTLERSKVRLLSRFHDLYLEPALRRLYPQVAPSGRQQREVQDAAVAFLSRLDELELLLAPGGGWTSVPPSPSTSSSHPLTLADCAYPGLLLYAELILPALGFEGGTAGGLIYRGRPRLRRWRDALWSHDAVARVLSELRPAAAEWLATKLRS